MRARRSVRSVKEAKELFTELSDAMECGERVKVLIEDISKIHEYVELVIKSKLSLIDVEEAGKNYYLVIENRFSNRCVQNDRESRDR